MEKERGERGDIRTLSIIPVMEEKAPFTHTPSTGITGTGLPGPPLPLSSLEHWGKLESEPLDFSPRLFLSPWGQLSSSWPRTRREEDCRVPHVVNLVSLLPPTTGHEEVETCFILSLGWGTAKGLGSSSPSQHGGVCMAAMESEFALRHTGRTWSQGGH